MQGRKTIKILATVTILVIICVAITYVKSDTKAVIATTKEFNSENLQENENMHIEEDASGDKVPVPNGYVGSKATGENEIDTGYVIYEGEEEVNDENVEEAQKTRNQYVWIPVPDISKFYGTDENGKKWGKLYEFTTSTGNNIDPITGAKPLNWSESDGIIKINNSSSYREPDIDKTYDDTDSILKLKYNNKKRHEFLIELEEDFNKMIMSVEKYRGFYVGRYETGNLSSDIPVIVKSNSDISGINLNGRWFKGIEKIKSLGKENENIETGIIWGCQWDRILSWLVESKNRTISQICNSIDWGNHQGDWGAKKVTGYSEDWKVANIYDFSGNMNEWTMEAASYGGRVTRGGTYYNSIEGVSSRLKDRATAWNSYGVNAGYRAMLYIK